MKPLDHQNRNWNLGNCYYITLEYIKDSEGLIAQGAYPVGTEFVLVHGLLDHEGRRIKHAWIEIGGVAHDRSNGQKIEAPCEEYYSANKAIPVRKFTRNEADALLCHLKATDGGLPITYWGNLPETTVQQALAAYNPASGEFAKGTIFSDPRDPSNKRVS